MTTSLDRVPAGIMTLSDDMRISGANEPMGAIVGRAAAELVGASIDVLLTQPSRVLFQTHVYPALKTQGRVDEIILQVVGGASEITPVLFNARREEEQAVVTYIAVVVPFHARARWETDLLAATRALEIQRAATQQLADEFAARHEQSERDRRYRDAFIGVLSHELRSPITTIYGMSHVLQESHSTMSAEALTLHLSDIEAEADRLHRLTEDLLVIARAEGGRLEVAPEPIAVARLVERSVVAIQAAVPDRHFEIETPDQLPLVAGEDVYVEQVIRNYLSNAAKYTPPGSRVRVVLTPEGGGVAVRVIDNGPGLGEEPSELLFELFYRSAQAARQASGAGIGLFVCRELVNAMGGTVWASRLPVGAEFGFWLPELRE